MESKYIIIQDIGIPRDDPKTWQTSSEWSTTQ